MANRTVPSRHPGAVLIVEDPTPGMLHHCRLTIATYGEIFEERWIPRDLLSDPIGLLDTAARWFAGDGEGTLITDRVPLYVFDDGDDKRHLDELVSKVREGGWHAGEGWKRADSGWITFTHPRKATVHLGVRRIVAETDTMVSSSGKEPTKDVALRLSRFHTLIGGAYHAMAGLSALGALRTRYAKTYTVHPPEGGAMVRPKPQPRWQWNHEPALNGRGDVLWERKPTAEELGRPWALAFDVRAMYLAAAAGVRVGWNQPRHTGAIQWDPFITGFFRIDARTLVFKRRGMVPLLNPRRIAADGSCWVTHPILAYVSERSYAQPEILDSWTCEKSGTYLRAWAEQIRDALPDAQTAGDAALRSAVKASYREAVGLMGRAGGLVSRRDWYAAVQDEAAVRMIRKLDTVQRQLGWLPMAIRTDCVWYASNDPDPSTLLKALGTHVTNSDAAPHIGQFKHDARLSVPMSAYTTQRSKR